MLINAQALNVVVTLARCGSFSQAAEELYRVPTALSYTLNKVESDLNTELFTRKGKMLIPTEAGRFFIKKAEAILAELEELQFSTQRIASGLESHLSISVNNIVSLNPLYELIAESEKLFPQTEIQIAIEAHDGVWDSLIEKRADIVVGAPNEVPSMNDICALRMKTVEWIFAVSPDHPLTKTHGVLKSSKLKRYSAVNILDTSVRLERKVAWQLRGQKSIIAPDYHSKIRMHIEGIGIGFLPKHFAQPYIDDGTLVSLPTQETKQPTPMFLAWRDDAPRPCYSWWLGRLKDPKIWEALLSPI